MSWRKDYNRTVGRGEKVTASQLFNYEWQSLCFERENLIQGRCHLKGKSLTILFDFGATYSFIVYDCVKILKLHVSHLIYTLSVSTPRNKPVITYFICEDLICLPLKDTNVIIGMNWLKVSRVLLNCWNKTVVFGTTEDKKHWLRRIKFSCRIQNVKRVFRS